MRYTSKVLAYDIINDSFYEKPFYVYPRNKNDEFSIKYNLTKEDIGKILHSINKNNFCEKIKNEDKNIKAEWLYHFNLLYQLVNEYGVMDMVSIYLKICEINNNILIISIHD